MAQRESKPLVLVADDVEDNRLIYTEYLTYRGYRVAEARNGEEAIAKARTIKPDVIIMDLSMPGIDGWEATRLLKADAKTKSICVIALTGHGEPKYQSRAAEVGVDRFILKPCLPSDLVDHIVACIAARGC